MIWITVVIAVIALLVVIALLLRGEDLSYLDQDGDSQANEWTPSDAHQQVLETIEGMNQSARGKRGLARLKAVRSHMEHMSDHLEPVSTIRPTTGQAPKGEWVMAPGVSSRRRLLYIHGGAWVAGSSRSHRAITDRLSQVAQAAVLALDYRLMPEHRYMDGVRDCQQAYRWLLDNGPDGPEPADFLVVAGDSAGGSHTLGLIAWIRDQGLPAPDAALALSPSTDLTLNAPSNRANVATDPLLGPSFGRILKVPLPLMWWASYLGFRVSPSNALLSPVRGDLSNLAPTLIHASESEMLLDNARRYTNKARAAGSPVELRTWPGMVHVWHIFAPLLPEADEAFGHIAEFLARVEAGQIPGRRDEPA
ncbi:alpha/beta hydrolase [Marinobacter salicampi]|uniref:alpha/beta hydrolase n=1 Tax=Marinobacter salicampi TaxID=435907 RepID=UPI00140B9620|nr:alpha/beta hydrolase [Marinobacter salicampi]